MSKLKKEKKPTTNELLTAIYQALRPISILAQRQLQREDRELQEFANFIQSNQNQDDNTKTEDKAND